MGMKYFSIFFCRYDEDSQFWVSPPLDDDFRPRQRKFQNRARRPSWPDSRRKRYHNGFGEDDEYSDLEGPLQRHNNVSELGANIRNKEWKDLPPIEKNFYVESPAVAQQSEVRNSVQYL